MTGVIAITGATGFIGRHLCAHFRRLGWDVRALVREPSRYACPENGVSIFRCELPDGMDPTALEGADVVVHCAYATREASPAQAYRINELGTRNLLDLSGKAGVRRFVFMSSQSAHEEARSYYGRSKLGLERLVALRRQLAIRPGLVLGNSASGLFYRICEMVRRLPVVPLIAGGRQLLQTVHIEDLCDAIGAAVARDLTGRLTVAETKPVEFRTFLQLLARKLRRRPVFVPVPAASALLMCRTLEALRVPVPVSSENLLGLAQLRAEDTRPDLERLGVGARPVGSSLDAIFAAR